MQSVILTQMDAISTVAIDGLQTDTILSKLIPPGAEPLMYNSMQNMQAGPMLGTRQMLRRSRLRECTAQCPSKGDASIKFVEDVLICGQHVATYTRPNEMTLGHPVQNFIDDRLYQRFSPWITHGSSTGSHLF